MSCFRKRRRFELNIDVSDDEEVLTNTHTISDGVEIDHNDDHDDHSGDEEDMSVDCTGSSEPASDKNAYDDFIHSIEECDLSGLHNA